MAADGRDAARDGSVTEYLRRLHEPAFGRPHALRDAQVTADGSRTVVTGMVLDALVGVPRAAIYACEDGTLRAVSTGSGSAHGARFSPDGSAMAFLSDRREPGVFQLFLLSDQRLGEAVPAPPVPGSIEYAHWSPDGGRILLGVAGLGADLSGGQGSGTNVTATGPEEAWRPVVETRAVDGAWRSLWWYDVATGEMARLSPDGVNCWEAGWCGPDAVVTIASDDPSEDAWYGAELRIIDTATGAIRVLLTSDVQLGLPTGSPDGRYASVVRAVCSDRWLVVGDVVVIDMSSGASRTVDTEGTDVARLQWIDAGRLGYVGQRNLDSVAGILDIAAGGVDEVFATALACGGFWFSPDGSFTADGRVATIQESYQLPQRVVLADKGDERVLASIANAGTDYLSSIAGTARAIEWPAPDGTRIEGILCTPAGNGPFPLVVNVHGGPVTAFRNAWSMRSAMIPLLVSRGYAVLNPNPRGSVGRGQEFAERVVHDMGGADTGDHLSGIDALVALGIADPNRIGVVGGSYGGFMASWLITQDQRFAAAVSVSPVTDWNSLVFTSNIGGWGTRFLGADPERIGTQAHTRSPVMHASKVRTPCLNIAGAKDRCTPPGQALEFHNALVAHGVESMLVTYPLEGHGVRSFPAVGDFLTRVVEWFGQHMPA